MGIWQCFFCLCHRRSIPLLDIPAHLQAKIIAKVDQKSYFRLQRTCKYIENLAKNSPSIKMIVVFPKGFGTRLKIDDNEAVRFMLIRFERIGPGKINEYFYEMPYGVIFDSIQLPPDYPNNFETFCKQLKKHRIMSKSISICDTDRATGTQYLELAKILKPTCFQCYADPPFTPYEELLQFYKFERIEVEISGRLSDQWDEIVCVAKKFLSISSDVKLRVVPTSLDKNELCNFLIEIIERLNSEDFPNLQKLYFIMRHAHNYRQVLTIEKLLRAFQRPGVTFKTKEINWDDVLPDISDENIYIHLRNTSSKCQVILNSTCLYDEEDTVIQYLQIQYEKRPASTIPARQKIITK